MAEEEQNKSEEATPHKLRRARERGMVARGMDLGFLSVVVGFSTFTLLAGAQALQHLSLNSARLLADTSARFEPAQLASLVQNAITRPFATVMTCALTVAAIVVLGELIQVRGIVVSTQPLKPDFNRLNPGKNLKRLFSVRMLIETLKNVAKIVLYGAALYLVVTQVAAPLARAPADGAALAGAWREGVTRFLMSFALVALLFAVVDQIIARRSFRKQMRMSRSELGREVKDREGEPRQKQKRKRMHAEFVKQTRALAGLKGADLLIVNPDHYAVALKYEPAHMEAPQIVAKGRNRFALLLKHRAFLWSILTLSNPPLARALYRSGELGAEIAPSQYQAVAEAYLVLRRTGSKPALAQDANAQD